MARAQDISKQPGPARRAAPAFAGALLGLAAGCAGLAEPEPIDFSDEPQATAALAPLPAPPAEGYAWDDLARRAADRSGEAEALLLEALAERHQAAVDTAWRDPQLRLGIHRGELEEETASRLATTTDPWLPAAPPEPELRPREWETRDTSGYEAGLRVYVENPFVNQWLRKRGAATAQAKEAESQEAAYALYCEVRALCLEAAALRAEIDLLEQIAAWRTQVRDIRSRQAAAGVTHAFDLIGSVTRAAAIRSDLREKEAEHRQLIRQIAILADVPAEQIRLHPPMAAALPDAAAWEAEALVDLALARRPDLARREREQAAAAHGVRAAQAGLLPWFDYVEGTYEGESAQAEAYEDYTTGFDQTDRETTEWQLRFAVNIPVFGWDGKEVRLSRAQLAAAAARTGRLRAQIRAEVAGVHADYLRACADRARLADESRQVQAVMTAKIDALAREPSVPPEDLLAAREDVVAYARVLLQADRECLRLAQWLETVTGGPLAPAP